MRVERGVVFGINHIIVITQAQEHRPSSLTEPSTYERQGLWLLELNLVGQDDRSLCEHHNLNYTVPTINMHSINVNTISNSAEMAYVYKSTKTSEVLIKVSATDQQMYYITADKLADCGLQPVDARLSEAH